MENITLDTGEYLGIAAISYRGDKLEFKLQYKKPKNDEQGFEHTKTKFIIIDKDWNIDWGWNESPFNKEIIKQEFEDLILSTKDSTENMYPEYFENIINVKATRLKKR